MPDIFPVLIFNARPAAGKSEILHGLKALPLEERIERFHVGSLHVIDDFPMLWSWFEEDALLEQVFERPRLHTSPEGYFLYHDLWHLLIRRLNLEYEKFTRDHPQSHTVVLEFSRGLEHGGYEAAYQHVNREILKRAACVYVRVSYEESLRKNRLRLQPRPAGQHSRTWFVGRQAREAVPPGRLGCSLCRRSRLPAARGCEEFPTSYLRTRMM